MTVDLNKKRRRTSAKANGEEKKKKLVHHLSISQPVNKKKKRGRIFAKYEEEKGTYTQEYLSNMFPHDIMLDILLKLPVKTLMRFRSVSKSWNYLIRKDHFFINMHLSRSKLQHEKIIFTDFDSCRLYSLDYNQGSNRLRSSRLKHIYKKPNSIWGSCNGLICAGGYNEQDLYILNPSTTEYRKLPYFNRKPKKRGKPEHILPNNYGFGYNPNTKDYVVVRLTRKKQFHSAVSIYSLRNNSWKKIQNIPYQASQLICPGQLVNGSLHWEAHSKLIKVPRDESVRREKAILAFEITTEKFVEVPCPDDHHGIMLVSHYQGKLCFYHDKYINNSFDLWVMNEYKVRESWTKVFNIRIPEGFTYRLCSDIRDIVLCSTKEGYILMRSGRFANEHLNLYDPIRRTRRPILGIMLDNAVNTYVPSIVALDFN